MVDMPSSDKGPILDKPEKYEEMMRLLDRKYQQDEASAQHRRKGDLEEFAKGSFDRHFDRTAKERQTVKGPILTEPKSKDVLEKRAALSVETDYVAKQFLLKAPLVVQKAMKQHKVTIGGVTPPTA